MDEIIVILGPTASGKTSLAIKLADETDAEIISADSRQVYKGMDVGTGKDIIEYTKAGIKYHLIDVVSAGEKYNLARFQTDFKNAVEEILSKSKKVILCGGTGLYIQSVIQNFTNTAIPESEELREELNALSNEELSNLLGDKTFDTRKRAIRAIEIGNQNTVSKASSEYNFKVFGLNPDVELRRIRISKRLKERIQQQGMIQEVEHLIHEGLSYEMLEYYGLEYKYLGRFLQGFIRYDDMYTKLETEIHRYAKRQMTFFRSMEKKGIEIDWLNNDLSLEEKVDYIKKSLKI